MSDDLLTLDYGKVATTIRGFISSQVKLRKKNGNGYRSPRWDRFFCLRHTGMQSAHKPKYNWIEYARKTSDTAKRCPECPFPGKETQIKYKEIDIERGKKFLLNNTINDKLAGGNFQQGLECPYFITTQQPIIY